MGDDGEVRGAYVEPIPVPEPPDEGDDGGQHGPVIQKPRRRTETEAKAKPKAKAKSKAKSKAKAKAKA